MSTEQVPKLDNPYDRLAYVLELLPDGNQSYSDLVVKKSDGIHSCAYGGIALKTGSIKEEDVKHHFFTRIVHSINLLGKGMPMVQDIHNEFGFTKKQKEREHECLEPCCKYRDQLAGMVVHMNDDHHFKRRFIGKIVRTYKDTETPEISAGDKFYRIKESFKTLFNF